MKKHIHLVFAGRVQKVGFRRTAQSFASTLSLQGWVKNLPDGRVELAAYGRESDLELLQNRLNAQFEIHEISMLETDTETPDGFDIR